MVWALSGLRARCPDSIVIDILMEAFGLSKNVNRALLLLLLAFYGLPWWIMVWQYRRFGARWAGASPLWILGYRSQWPGYGWGEYSNDLEAKRRLLGRLINSSRMLSSSYDPGVIGPGLERTWSDLVKFTVVKMSLEVRDIYWSSQSWRSIEKGA